MSKIFIVEDEKTIRDELSIFLSRYGYQIEAPDNFENVIENIKESKADLILLDINLPIFDGYYICREVRKFSEIPIIVVTSRDSDIDELMSMNLGADDYVVKPFSLIELAARIKANIRRAGTYQALPNNSIIEIKDIEIDPQRHTVTRKGISIDLTPIEFELLYLLASHPGQAYSKERLYELIWKEPYFGNENVLNTHINRLRLKLKSDAEDSTIYIKTLWGIGYKMEEE